jgi:hypothetical protein
MNSIIDFIVFWKDLITKVFGEYPLAAALVSIVAVAAFYVLDQQARKGKRPTNLIIVFFGWAILVPIVGLVMTILGKLWAILEAAVPRIVVALASFYRIYDQHPLLVLFLIGVGVVSYFLWRRFRPDILPNQLLRVAFIAAVVILVAHILSPLANWLLPASAPETRKDVTTKQVEPAASNPLPIPSPKPASSMPSAGASSASQPASATSSAPAPPPAASNAKPPAPASGK